MMKQLSLGLMRLFVPQTMTAEKLQAVASELDSLEFTAGG